MDENGLRVDLFGVCSLGVVISFCFDNDLHASLVCASGKFEETCSWATLAH